MEPATLYLFFWTLGCAVGVLAGLALLHRRRVLTPQTATALAVAWLFLFIGSKWHSRLEALPWTEALLVSPAELFAPGRRLPLGLLASGIAAAGTCLVLRLPWRQVGDALAVFWSILIPVGRIGCLASGCCLGIACSPWLRPLCWRYGPRSEAFHQQLRAGLIPPTSGASLPVHPLPLYFALASLVTLAILLWLLRRDAPAGMLLLAFCLLRPAAKLALEPLRAEPALPWLMVGIPAATLATAAIVSASLLARRRLAAPMLAMLVASIGPAAHAGDLSPAAIVERYAQNPVRNRRLLRRLEREGHGTHPVVLLALADARLRSGSFTAAEQLFARAAAADPQEPLGSWAALGQAWASILAGRAPEQARQNLARMVDDGTHPALHAAAGLAAAYARYWAGDDDPGTIAAFDAAAAAADGSLVDDARYGAARARIRAGDLRGALPMLHDLATWHVNGRPGPAPPSLVALDMDAVLRAGFERYRRGPLRTPEGQLHTMLDGDGASLARAALRDLGERVSEPEPVPRGRPAATAVAPARMIVETRAPPAGSILPPLDVVSRWLRPLLLAAALLAVLLLVNSWWWDRRIPPGGTHGSRIG